MDHLRSQAWFFQLFAATIEPVEWMGFTVVNHICRIDLAKSCHLSLQDENFNYRNSNLVLPEYVLQKVLCRELKKFGRVFETFCDGNAER